MGTDLKVKKYGSPAKKGGSGLFTFDESKATRRVIAPYVNLVRHGKKGQLEERDKTLEYLLQKRPSILRRDLKQFLDDTVDLPTLLHESLDALKCATDSAGGRLYMVNNAINEIYISPKSQPNPMHKISWKVEEGTTLASYVAARKEFVMVEDILADPRFPDGIPYTDPTVKSVLCVPIVTPVNECIAVIELYRDVLQPAFKKAELKIAVVVAGWMGTSIHQNKERMIVQRQQKLNECLMELTKCYFAGNITLGKLINEIVSFAKDTIDAEKATFYILNSENMTAEIYDESLGGASILRRKIRANFAKDKSIASTVARSGMVINVKNALKDFRSSSGDNRKSGFIERSILAMPIMGTENVLGVVEAVNKVGELCFSKTDEDVFKTFTLYCALALYHSRIIDNWKRASIANEIALCVLKRHIYPCAHDLENLRENLEFDEPISNINEFGWYITPERHDQMPQMIYYMMMRVMDNAAICPDELMKFILSVKLFHRDNEYHNWEHAFTVCHCMYNILQRNMDLFESKELNGLLVAALCHDIDHGGVSNSFLHLSNDYIAQLYEESSWENHHYFVTMLILDEIQVFKNLSSDEYRDVCQQIKEGILATDLTVFFRIKAKMHPIVNSNTFDWNNSAHRAMLISITMTASDFSGCCKPFPIAKKITDRVYKEYYHQGDIEREMGYIPLSMMDREKQNIIPEDQIEFLTVLVIPVCDLLRQSLPNISALYEEAANLKDAWLEVIRIRNDKCWNIEDSISEWPTRHSRNVDD